MTFEDFVGARLLIAERRYGAPLRAQMRAQQAAEDAAVEATKSNIRKVQGAA